MILHSKKEPINPLLPWHPIGITQQSIVQPKGKQKAKQQRNGVWCILILSFRGIKTKHLVTYAHLEGRIHCKRYI